MSFPRYPAYKDSGIPLLKEIPEEWLCIKLQEAASDAANSFVDGPFGSSLKNEEYVGQGVPLVQLNNIGIGRHILSTLNFVEPEKADELGRHNAFPGDLVIAKMADPVARAAIVSDQFARYVIVADCIRLEPDISRMDPRFLVYSINSPYFKALAEMASKGIGRVRINLGSLRQLQLCCPPVDIQRRIATFLDHETGKIDALIAEQQRLIELLQEKRQAVISHAVTKGINPDAPMKDSGVEWLGEVPEHWVVTPIRLAARIESGHTPSRSRDEYWIEEDCIYPWFTLGDVWQIRDGRTEYVYETQEKVSKVGLDHSAARMLPAETVILSRTASVGFSGILGVPMATTQDFVNWICGAKLAPEFLLYAFRAMGREFERLKYGSTHNTIYMPDIFSFRMPLPPLDEQEQIVSCIRETLECVDSSLDDLLSSKRLLQERRSALISAAVTGQIDVRGLVHEVAAA